MAKRHKRGSVTPGLRKEWLRRFEEDGELAPKIALDDEWDVRTVRRQLDIARQEREVREARHVVLRQALQDHYADLCSFAGKLDSRLMEGFNHISFEERDERLYQALKQHLPRSPIWRRMEKWENLIGQLESSVAALRKFIVGRAEERLPLEFTGPQGYIDQLRGFIDGLIFHFQALAKGWKGLEGVQYVAKPLVGQTHIQFGAFGWVVAEGIATDVQKCHNDLLTEGTGWKEYEELYECSQNLMQLRDDLRDELAALILRRVVPGRCLYCPF
jgi:hypothetical protein